MPRKNKRKPPKHHVHAPSVYDNGFNIKCHGCAFTGQGFICLTSDGKCLKGGDVQAEDSSEEVVKYAPII